MILCIDLAKNMRRRVAAWIGAQHAVTEIDAGNAKAKNGGVPLRGQFAVKLDVTGVFLQQSGQTGLVMMCDQRGKLQGCVSHIHDFAWISMQQSHR